LLALLSKESAYALPLLLIPLELFALPSRRIQSKFWPMAGFILLTGMTFCYRWSVLGGIGGYQNSSGKSSALSFGIGTVEGLLVRAPAQMLLGYNWLQPGVAVPIVLASLTSALLLTLAFGVRPLSSGRGDWSRRRIIWFSLSWIILAYVPAHFLLQVGPALTGSRVFYLSSAGMAIFIALLLAGIDHAGIRQGAKVLLVLLLSLGLFHNLQAWQWTSELSSRLLVELKRMEPSPPPRAEFVFREMPDTIRGVFFFHAGLMEGINMTFDRHDLTGRREATAVSGSEADASGRPIIKVNWVGRTDALIERAKD
jgi:hypothetical protein